MAHIDLFQRLQAASFEVQLSDHVIADIQLLQMLCQKQIEAVDVLAANADYT